MLNILLAIILIIALFILTVIITGIRLLLTYENTEGCLKILILKKIKIYQINFPDKKEEEDKKDNERKKRDYKKILKLAKPCVKYIGNYIKSILKSVNITKFTAHIVFGLESYADTGKYIGIIWGIFAVLNSSHKNIQLSAEPSFNGKLNFKGEADITIRLYKLIMPTIKLISKKEIQKLIRGVLNG